MKTKAVTLGSIYGMFHRVVVVVCGFLISVVIARKLGPEFFGLYTFVISILAWVEAGASAGLPSVFRKVVSENKATFRPIVTSLGRLSVPYCLTTMFLFALVSPAVAYTMHDDRLTALLIIASLDIPFFVMFSTYLGVLNGHGNFLLHSALGAVRSISRAVLMIAAALLLFGIEGALLGNALGSICGLLLAFHYARKLTAQYAPVRDGSMRLSSPDIRSKLVSFGVPYLSASLLSSVLINLDIWFVKALTGTSTGGDEVVGYYAAAYNLARIPYLMMTAIIMTIFPAISNAVSEHRTGDARTLIWQQLRLMLLILMPAILIVYATADEVIELVFSSAYLPASESFKILFIGVSVFSIFLFFINIIAADNKPRFGVVISLILLPAAIVLNYFLIDAFGIVGAALAISTVSLIGLIASGAYVWRRFGRIIDAYSLLRISIASGGVYFVAGFDELYQLHLLIGYAVLGFVYGLMLLILRETDLSKVKSLLHSLLNPSVSN